MPPRRRRRRRRQCEGCFFSRPAPLLPPYSLYTMIWSKTNGPATKKEGGCPPPSPPPPPDCPWPRSWTLDLGSWPRPRSEIVDLGRGQDIGSWPRPRSCILATSKILDLCHGEDLGSWTRPRSNTHGTSQTIANTKAKQCTASGVWGPHFGSMRLCLL